MIFGEPLSAAASTGPAEWIGEALSEKPWTVGALVPDGYESLLRLHAPAPTVEGWWDLYRDLFVLVASVGTRHTTTPEAAWFAVWEGHGFGTSTTHVAWPDPPANDTERLRREAERERLRAADRQRNATLASALAAIPRFDLPHRSYFLTQGPLSAVADLRYPDFDGWRNPDLIWPDDRSWFVATDVDFWSLYVGGTEAFIDELAARASTDCATVGYDDHLPTEPVVVRRGVGI